MTRPRACAALLGVLLFTAIGCAAACGDETVQIGDSVAVLLRPTSPVASVILMPGGDGLINAGPKGEINRLVGNQLVRTRNAYLARGPRRSGGKCRHRSCARLAIYGRDQEAGHGHSNQPRHHPCCRGDCSRSKTECARAHLGISNGRIRGRPELRLDPWHAQCAAAHADHSPSRRRLQVHPACRRGVVCFLVRRAGPCRVAQRWDLSRRPLRGARLSRL
jgi:hypothetical protein